MFTEARGDRSDFVNVGVLITDTRGYPDAGVGSDPWSEALRAGNAGIRMITIGIGENEIVNNVMARNILSYVASYPQSRNYYALANMAGLQGIKEQLIQGFCKGEFPPSNPTRGTLYCVQ